MQFSAVGGGETFIKTRNVFLIGDSWLAWRNGRGRGNVQNGLEDLGFRVENFAQNGVTLNNFWWKENMSWEKWAQVNKKDAMVITIGFNEISDRDMNAKGEVEVGNILQQALEQSNHVVLIIPNQPSRRYFIVRAEWYLLNQRDDPNEPDIFANAKKRQQLYASRHQKLVSLFKSIQASHQSLRIVEMQDELTPEDIFEDGCHLSHQGAAKTAHAIAQSLKCQRRDGAGKSSAYASKVLLAIVMFMVARFFRRRLLHKRPKTRM